MGSLLSVYFPPLESNQIELRIVGPSGRDSALFASLETLSIIPLMVQTLLMSSKEPIRETSSCSVVAALLPGFQLFSSHITDDFAKHSLSVDYTTAEDHSDTTLMRCQNTTHLLRNIPLRDHQRKPMREKQQFLESLTSTRIPVSKLPYEQFIIGLLYSTTGDADLRADFRVVVGSLRPVRGIPQCK